MDSEPRNNSVVRSVIVLTVCFLTGIGFGFAMEKGRVFEPQVIREQMIFKTWIMIKMFLSAMACSTLMFSLLTLLPIEWLQKHMQAALDDFESTISKKNILSIVLGAFLLGVGMTLSGACPGMVLPQTGAGAYMAGSYVSFFGLDWIYLVGRHVLTLAGALIGSLIYGLLHDRVVTKIFPEEKLVAPISVPKITNIKFAYLSIPMCVILYGAVVALELIFPWKEEVQRLHPLWPVANGDTFFQHLAWPPSVCGTIIGLLQVLIVLFCDDTLGGSSSYATVVSQLFFTSRLQEMFPFFAKRRCGLANWWQVLYVLGGVAGGAISSVLSNSWGQVAGVYWYFALIGGFLLTFGARLASGCTSGHGLSGSGLLMLASFIAVPVMFAGAIGTALIMHATDNLLVFRTW